MEDYKLTDYITPEEYMAMRKIVGWSEFPLEQAAEGLKNSFILVCFRVDGKPVAIGRAVSDRGYVVYIADVIVVPECQGKGLGRAVMNTLMEKIKDSMKPGYRIMISLLAAKGKEEFYTKFGFVDRPNEDFGCGMHQWLEG
jgi:GNAT superfamily N-acetyltransferase